MIPYFILSFSLTDKINVVTTFHQKKKKAYLCNKWKPSQKVTTVMMQRSTDLGSPVPTEASTSQLLPRGEKDAKSRIQGSGL